MFTYIFQWWKSCPSKQAEISPVGFLFVLDFLEILRWRIQSTCFHEVAYNQPNWQEKCHLLYIPLTVHAFWGKKNLPTVDGSEIRRSPVDMVHIPIIYRGFIHTSQVVGLGISAINILIGGFNPSEKYARQIGSFPQFSGWKLKTIWNHHLAIDVHPNTKRVDS